MTNPHIRPCTFEELYAVPVSGLHYKASRAKVIPIATSAVQPTLTAENAFSPSDQKTKRGALGSIEEILLIVGVGMLAIGCYAYFTGRQARDEEE